MHRVEKIFDMDLQCSPTELAGYLRSWSAYHTYCTKHDIVAKSKEDPVCAIEEYLETNNMDLVQGKWPVTLLWTRKISKE